MILDLVSQPIHASVSAEFFNIPAKSGCEKFERRFGACRRLGTDDGPLGSCGHFVGSVSTNAPGSRNVIESISWRQSTRAIGRHTGPKPVAGLPPNFVHDKARYHSYLQTDSWPFVDFAFMAFAKRSRGLSFKSSSLQAVFIPRTNSVVRILSINVHVVGNELVFAFQVIEFNLLPGRNWVQFEFVLKLIPAVIQDGDIQGFPNILQDSLAPL